MRVDLAGQMSLFDDVMVSFIEKTSEFSALMLTKKAKEKETYLQKGERILSLVREKEQREFKEISFMECFNFTKYSTMQVYSDKISYIKRCVGRYLSGLLTTQEGFETAFCELGNNVSIATLEEESYEDTLLMSVCKGKGVSSNYTTGCSVRLQGYEEKLLMPFTSGVLSLKKSGRGYKLENYAYYTLCVDGIKFFNNLVTFLNLRATVHQLVNTTNDSIYQRLLEIQVRHLQDVCKSYEIVGLQEQLLEQTSVCSLLERCGIQYLSSNTITCNVNLSRLDFTILYILGELPIEDWEYERAWERYGKTETVDLSGGINNSLLVEAFDTIFEEYIIEKIEDEYQNNSKTDYAKSFQTKKNLSDKLVNAMEHSKWNKHFGYVEFDSDCDLELVEQLESEFEQIASLYDWKKQEMVTIRFRKLGHHKAAGMYFSEQRCICVDINYPGSLVHEYMHMLDYTKGKLSKKNDFIPMYMRYKSCLDDYYSIRKEGNTKYNKAYYSMHTEVFARCGEMYLQRVKGMDTSIIKPLDSFAYPEDEKLNVLIKEYFEKLLVEI